MMRSIILLIVAFFAASSHCLDVDDLQLQRRLGQKKEVKKELKARLKEINKNKKGKVRCREPMFGFPF